MSRDAVPIAAEPASIEDLLRAVEAGDRARKAVELSPSPIVTLTRSGQIIDASAAFHSINHAYSGSLVGRSITRVMEDDVAERHVAAMAPHFDRAKDVVEMIGPVHSTMRTLRGDLLPVEIAVAFPPGPRSYAIGYIHVLTREQVIVQRLQEAAARAEEIEPGLAQELMAIASELLGEPGGGGKD